MKNDRAGKAQGALTRDGSGAACSGRRSMRRRAGVLWLVVLVAALTLGMLAGCQPQSSASDEGKGEQASQTEGSATDSATTAVDFTQSDSGFMPDSARNAAYVNAGNRGCNACHEDLGDVLPMGTAGNHLVTSSAGYGRVFEWRDCTPCHSGTSTSPGAGCYLAGPIHNMHYSSEEFVEGNNNCWSCHAVTVEGEMVMWDDLKYTPMVDDMETYVGSQAMSDWMTVRGWDNGRISGMALAPEIKLSNVALDQDPSDPDSVFTVANNIEPEINADEYTLTITGVNNPQTFTLEELKAMPQTTMVKSQMCPTNGDGGFLIDNIEMTGVSVSYLIDLCGGLEEGVNAWGGTGWDDWDGCFSVDQSFCQMDSTWDDEAMIVLQYYGEDLTVAQGAPANLFVPGTPGIVNTKWIKTLDFAKTDTAYPAFRFQSNSGWFTPNKDGLTYQFGEPVKLEGYSNLWSWANTEGLTAIQISGDYGKTWTTIDIDLDNYDAEAWVHFTAEWEPPAPGTYNLKVRGVSTNENATMREGNVIVTVTE